MNDLEVFDAGVKSASEFGNNEFGNYEPHFIYSGYHYNYSDGQFDQLRKIFLAKMSKYRVQSAFLTTLLMERWNLVTTERVKQFYEGKLKNDKVWSYTQQSIQDDLDTFFEDLQQQKKIKNGKVVSFYFPKLTEAEMQLVEERNKVHLTSYLEHYMRKNRIASIGRGNWDVDPAEMKQSDSKSKYVRGQCIRITHHLMLETNTKS